MNALRSEGPGPGGPDPAPAVGAPPAVEVRGLTVAYDGRPALRDASVALPAGSMTAVVGPNGAGKSTLVKAMLGLVPSVSGDVRFFGLPHAEARPRIAYVPQRESVDWDYPIRARDVVAMGLYGEIGLLRRVRREHLRRADEALERVGMGELGDRRIGALSGGQQQRVFLARALVQGADLYVMDEPFAGVDATTERALLELMRGLRAAGSTLLCVHHDLGTVPEFFDHVVLLNRRTVAAGPVGEAFTQPHLEACYGRNVRAAGPAADER